MSITVQILGAAEEVTGSCHLVTAGAKRLLLDCGLIQGQRNRGIRVRENGKTLDRKSVV